ncbi:hypothetical protein [Umezakia ovalisporum]|jgi:hypothetical protein|uniref:Uncharacterized protein n=1 Tax=Umezakia ovalisporum FSS-62 TaxID=2971776 RepID=A0AA43GX67_9CYAN|nr:hypothetical protein [Umezakia ovalisporum]MDH6063279.1 hypothetical protein [Umezakia ovalisporum FSS-62]
MLKIRHLSLNLLGTGIICCVISHTITLAAAQGLMITNNPAKVTQPAAVGSLIYGSPIPIPMPVDPRTGLIRSRSDGDYHSYPIIIPSVNGNFGLTNQTSINPINPIIRNSPLVNPVMINNSPYGVRSIRRSRVRINHSRQRTRSAGRSRLTPKYPR